VKKKPAGTVDAKWTFSRTATNDLPNEPEDYGVAFFTLPFCYRLRFAIIPHPNREPTLSIYEDRWDNESRCWRQAYMPYSVSLSTMERMMELVEEEIANNSP